MKKNKKKQPENKIADPIMRRRFNAATLFWFSNCDFKTGE